MGDNKEVIYLSQDEVIKAKEILKQFSDDRDMLKAKLECFDGVIDLIAFVEEMKVERERWAWARKTIFNTAKWLAAIGVVIGMVKSFPGCTKDDIL